MDDDVAEQPEEEAGGDLACWAHLVCGECGRLAEESGARVCDACGADLPARDLD